MPGVDRLWSPSSEDAGDGLLHGLAGTGGGSVSAAGSRRGFVIWFRCVFAVPSELLLMVPERGKCFYERSMS